VAPPFLCNHVPCVLNMTASMFLLITSLIDVLAEIKHAREVRSFKANFTGTSSFSLLFAGGKVF